MHLGLSESGVPLTPLVQFFPLQHITATIHRSHHFQTHFTVELTPGAMAAQCAQCVAGGHYEFPYLPEIPGEKAWLAAGSEGEGGHRRVVHVVHYDDPAPW